jgi:hypothetical protein
MLLTAVVCTFLLLACNGGGSDSGDSSDSDDSDDDPHTPPEPTHTFNTSGGQGGADGGRGGRGGDFRVYMKYGSMGPLEVLASDTADAGFTAAPVTANLGDNPLAITTDTTLQILAPTTPGHKPADGTPYLIEDRPFIYIWEDGGNWADQEDSSGDPLAPVTGLSVALGSTLTLALNYTDRAMIVVSNDIDNAGTITTENESATRRGGLGLAIASYIGSGAIDTSGSDDGQSGGKIDLTSNGSFFNSGTINSAGADSATATAGNGGTVRISVIYNFENTGTITTSGGAATGSAGYGGTAGGISIRADFAVNNSGNLTASGGDGIDSGGYGAEISFRIINAGDLRNSGDLDTSGGNATGGDGGKSWHVVFDVAGGGIINSGNITTNGGSTAEPTSNGGDAGDISLHVRYADFKEFTPPGDILFSGNVDTSGGDAVAGGNGGAGGDFEIDADYEDYPLGQRVALLGYQDSITTSGGDGNHGGDAGDVSLICDPGSTATGCATPGCNITNEVAITGRGGNVAAGATATPADGGKGASVYFVTDYYYGMFDSQLDHVVNSGDIDVSGGASRASTTTSSGIGGDVSILGYNGVTNSGAITTVGGDDPDTSGGTNGCGNSGGSIRLYSELGAVKNSGNLTSDGGDGEYRGGDAALIGLFGAAIVNSGALDANGGDADPALAGSVGGNGNDVELFAPNGMSDVANTGSATNAGGTGETAGEDGDYIVGGLLM